MIDKEQVEKLIGHAAGGVCPFGINEGVKVYLDDSLKKLDTIYPACGSSNSAIKLTLQKLQEIINYNKWIDVCKDEWIITENHHEPIISKDKFDEVQQILNRKTKVNKNDDIDLFSGYLKCSHCGSNLIIKKSKNQIYYYCSSYIKYKSCLKYSINKKKLEQMVKDEIIKKINIEQLDRKTLNELIDMIYIIDKNNIKIEFKNI